MAYKYKINPHTQKLDKVLDAPLVGDMNKEDYDQDENGLIDKAESLDDGAGNTATAANVKDAVNKKHEHDSEDVYLDTQVTKTIYVDINRTDSYIETGSPTKPFKTITSANALADAGCLIYIFPGTYTENVTTKQGVVYYANSGDYKTSQVIMTGKIEVGVSDVYIVGFDFQSPPSHAVQVISVNIDNLHILKNRIYNAGNDPILFNAFPALTHTNIYINDNHIEKVDGTSDSGIWFYHVTGGEIKNNRIWTVGYNGILAEGIKDLVISGNDIRGCGQSGMQIAYSVASNTIVENNYFYGNNTSLSSDKGGIAIYPSVDDLKVRHNIFDSNYNGFTVRNKAGVASSDIFINYNKFINSTNYGIMNLAQSGGDLNAKWNWFGDSSGCNDDVGTINGTGDAITTNVVAEPLETYGNRAIDIRNDSSVSGATVKDALNDLDSGKLQKNSISGSFTTVDGKTITIVDGQVTSIA